MTADPHTETNADLLKRLYAALKHNKSCSCGECCGGLNTADALAARLEAAERENTRLVRDLADARKAMEFLANETLFGSIVAEYAQKKLAAAQQPPAEEPDG